MLAADGLPLRASLLLGDWRGGTGLFEATFHRGGKTEVRERVVISNPDDFSETSLPDGTASTIARTVPGLHIYVEAEPQSRTGKDGKPVVGADGRAVFNVENPVWHIWQSNTGTFGVAAPKAPADAKKPVAVDPAAL